MGITSSFCCFYFLRIPSHMDSAARTTVVKNGKEHPAGCLNRNRSIARFS
jgi:hypothetical protein